MHHLITTKVLPLSDFALECNHEEDHQHHSVVLDMQQAYYLVDSDQQSKAQQG